MRKLYKFISIMVIFFLLAQQALFADSGALRQLARSERDKGRIIIPPGGITTEFLSGVRPRVISIDEGEGTVRDILKLVNSLFSASGWNSGRIGKIDLLHDLLMSSDISFDIGRLRFTFFKVTLPEFPNMCVFYIATRSVVIGHGTVQYAPYSQTIWFRYAIHKDEFMPATVDFKIGGQHYGKETLPALMAICLEGHLFQRRPIASFILAEGFREIADSVLPDLWMLRNLLRQHGNFKDTERGLEYRIRELLPHEEDSRILRAMLLGQI
ncbi:MAG: hypothetical protein HQ547_03060 [Candidatus Omnitrophica bacterium]|nr:hypothetical protein [Candidatus Omnitrophota bacterium]